MSITLVGGVIAFALAMWLLPQDSAVVVFHYAGAWASWLIWGLWAVALVQVARVTRSRWEISDSRFPRWMLVVTLAVAFVLAIVHSRPGLRVVNDETVLMATSKYIYQEARVMIPSRGFDFGRGYEISQYFIDRRPTGYPSLLAAVHAVTGYRIENAYWLNRAAVVGLAFALLLIGWRLHRPWGALLLPGLMLSHPIVAVLGAGGGFDVLNLLFIAICWHAAILLWERMTRERLVYLGWSVVALANIRYESVLFVVPFAVIVLLGYWRERRSLFPAQLALAPWLMFPWLCRMRLYDNPEVWQLETKPIGDAERVFGPEFFGDNIGHALNFLFSPKLDSGNLVLPAALGLAALGFFILALVREFRRRGQSGLAPVHAIVAAGLVAQVMLVFFYFWGQLDDPVAQRLGLPLLLLLAAAPVGVLGHLRPPTAVAGTLALLMGILVFGRTAPQVHLQSTTGMNRSARMHNWILDWATHYEGKNVIVIEDKSGLPWMLMGTPTLPFAGFAGEPHKLRWHWDHGSFREVFGVQRMHAQPMVGWVPEDSSQLPEGVTYEVVDELWVEPLVKLRLIRITSFGDVGLRSESVEPDETPMESFLRIWAKNLP